MEERNGLGQTPCKKQQLLIINIESLVIEASAKGEFESEYWTDASTAELLRMVEAKPTSQATVSLRSSELRKQMRELLHAGKYAAETQRLTVVAQNNLVQVGGDGIPCDDPTWQQRCSSVILVDG